MKSLKLVILLYFTIAQISISCSQQPNNTMKSLKQLTESETNVIINKGTERPFSGKYLYSKEEGTYLCKNCDAPLYKSQNKFDSHCGWPSFDDEIDGAVKRIPDADGRRTEIVCSNCGAHLGHVFEGEGYTEKNTRHCVNSISLNFEPKKIEPKLDTAIFAGGCFWGVEYYFQRANGVLSTEVGYIGGKTQNPTYHDVCYTNTGHAEAIRVVFDANKTSYETLLKLFFEIHDFTQVNRQGPDVGEQYRSEVFYLNDDQKAKAQSIIQILIDKKYKVATKLTLAGTFWIAENYHQQYYDKKGGMPYCHSKKSIF